MSIENANASQLSRQALEQSGQPDYAAARAPSGSSIWSDLIQRIAAEAGIDPNLAVGVAVQESGLDPDALNKASGAVGLMQLLPSTAAELGVNPNDIMSNIFGGVRYLQKQLHEFGDKAKALAAYNWGSGHVAEAVERWGEDWLRHAPSETQHNVASILSRSANNRPSMGARRNLFAAGNTSTDYGTPSVSLCRPGSTLSADAMILQLAVNAYLLSGILE